MKYKDAPKDKARRTLTEKRIKRAVEAEMTAKGYKMIERGRQGALPGDLPLLEMVETRLDEGPESAEDFFHQELLSGALRQRLMNRP